MIFTSTKLAGAFIIDLEEKPDSRGFFARTFCADEFLAHGLKPTVAQCNLSFNFYFRLEVWNLKIQFQPT